ncbi:hypothetical protein E2C01_063237 [Portunus trituberculatus]|uniref:Uncharacterized protein n=1 Tax=Portunus trituberculatus TaxID=210409 RepID=A0A5B7HK97_PORTR|nr:hypothetical protein [Portunus trituberculatus]
MRDLFKDYQYCIPTRLIIFSKTSDGEVFAATFIPRETQERRVIPRVVPCTFPASLSASEAVKAHNPQAVSQEDEDERLEAGGRRGAAGRCFGLVSSDGGGEPSAPLGEGEGRPENGIDRVFSQLTSKNGFPSRGTRLNRPHSHAGKRCRLSASSVSRPALTYAGGSGYSIIDWNLGSEHSTRH